MHTLRTKVIASIKSENVSVAELGQEILQLSDALERSSQLFTESLHLLGLWRRALSLELGGERAAVRLVLAHELELLGDELAQLRLRRLRLRGRRIRHIRRLRALTLHDEQPLDAFRARRRQR